MTPTDLLIPLDAAGGVLMLATALFLGSRTVAAILRRDCSPELHLLCGLSNLVCAASLILFVGLVRRELAISGESTWWLLESWIMVAVKMQLVAGAVQAIHGITVERRGWWPALFALAWVAAFLAFPAPAYWLAHALHRMAELLR